MARQREIEARFAVTKGDPSAKDERAVLRLELDASVERLRELKEAQKTENARRNFAGSRCNGQVGRARGQRGSKAGAKGELAEPAPVPPPPPKSESPKATPKETGIPRAPRGGAPRRPKRQPEVIRLRSHAHEISDEFAQLQRKNWR